MTPPHPSERSYGPFVLTDVEVGRKGRLWSVRFDNQQKSEFDRFLSSDRISRHPQFEDVLGRLDEMANRSGFRFEWFKHEGYLDDVTGYPKVRFDDPDEFLQIRLYCMRFSLRALVLGLGCIKAGRGLAEKYPGCESAIQRTHYAYLEMKSAIVAGTISIEQLETGQLSTRRFGG